MTGNEFIRKIKAYGRKQGIAVILNASRDVKDFWGIFVFSTAKTLKQFTESGWAADAQADAAAKSGTKGGAVAGAITVAPGVDLYQLTETGLALQATIQGTKYYKDDDLNGK